MTTIAKNNSGSTKKFLATVLQNGSQSQISDIYSPQEIAASSDLNALILAGDIVINDGVSDLTVSQAIDFNSDSMIQVKDSNTGGGTINAAYGSPIECSPSTGTLECVVPFTAEYVIFGKLSIGTNLNKDNGALELAYGIDTGSGAVVGAKPWSQNQNAKKNKRNGICGTWGEVSLNAGDKVFLFLSTLGDSASWADGELFISTWP